MRVRGLPTWPSYPLRVRGIGLERSGNFSAAAIAASLMDAEARGNLVMDNWFVREAGSSGRPPWHHDVSYFDFEGTMTVLWLPLESSRAGTGLRPACRYKPSDRKS